MNLPTINSERIEDMKKTMLNSIRQISIERAVLYTQSDQETKGEAQIIRRAKATANILDHVQIGIREGELLAANRTVRPRSGIISPEMDPHWIMNEIDTIHERPQDKFVFLDQDKEIFKNELYPYWKNQCMYNSISKNLPLEVVDAVKNNIFKLNQMDKGQGHIIIDFPSILRMGISGYINQLKELIDKENGNDFYKAGLIVFEAVSRHFTRYKEEAGRLFQQARCSEERKNELQWIASTCDKLSLCPPDTFEEALQLVWMVSIAMQYESNASSLSLGRMDQYLYDYYQYSLRQGTPKESLMAYLADFYIKTNDVVILRSAESAKAFAGFPVGYNIVLGGVNEFGYSAANDLSYLFLDTYHYVKMPQPNLSVRLNELIPEKFLLKTCETIRLGTGIPQLFNDEVCIPAFLSKGVSLEDARDFAIVGCVEVTIPGRTYGLHDIALFNLLRVMEVTLYELQGLEQLDYETVIKRIKENISFYVKLVTDGSNVVDQGHREFAPTPFLSVMIQDCLSNGKDVTEGGARYNFSGVQGVGEANLSDSLFVLKKLVFENKEMAFDDLMKALQADFAGEYKTLQNHVIQDFDKYGNDIDEVDYIAADIFRFYAKELAKYKNIRDGVFIPGAYTVSAHIPLGEDVGATPDGRNAREQLADGGLSPMVGRDRLGPTAVLKSVSKLDNMLTVNGSLLNVKFQPNTLKGTEGITKFANFLRAFTKLKIQHIQFNVQNRETLLDAQKNPDKYGGLVVRVAGYSAFFTELNESIQNDIIARSEHVL